MTEMVSERGNLQVAIFGQVCAIVGSGIRRWHPMRLPPRVEKRDGGVRSLLCCGPRATRIANTCAARFRTALSLSVDLATKTIFMTSFATPTDPFDSRTPVQDAGEPRAEHETYI